MTWKLLSTKPAFSSKWISIVEWHMLTHQGKEKSFFLQEAMDVVMVVGETSAGKILLVKQFYIALQRVVTSVVAGFVEPGFTPLETAEKELQEEAGYRTAHIIPLGTTAKGKYATGLFHFYLARGLEENGGQELEDAEEIEVMLATRDEVKLLVDQGKFEEGYAELAVRRALDYIACNS